MTEDDPSIKHEPAASELTAKVGLDAVQGGSVARQLLPGLVAIALYMLVLAAVLTLGVAGGHYSAIFLLPGALFVTASFGLLRLFRWAWALTLAAVFMLMSYHIWLFAQGMQLPSAIQAGLNLVFFLYLVRVDVRSRLR